MNSVELGRRLKAARLAKKMTQSEVVGNFITRNMLSQIESGTATPSMKTLEYLAGVLEIPMERLVAEQEDAMTEQSALTLLQDVKTMLEEECFESVMHTEVPSGVLEDEFHALRGIAFLRAAEQLAETRCIESMQTALLHAKHAAQEAAKGIYANEARVAQAQELITNIARYLSDYYSNLAQAGV